MSFGNMLRELCCSGFAKKAAEDLAEQYGGESGKNFIGGVLDGDNEVVKNLMGAMSGKQQLSVQNLASMVQSQGGEALVQHAETRGLAPELMEGIMGILKKDSGDGGAGGFDMTAVAGLIGSLTNRGGGGSPADGFMQLLGGAGGSDGGEANSSNIVKILLGLAKSYFSVKSGSSPAIQGWDAAGAKNNEDDSNFLNWALNILRDLFFPDKKPKEIIEAGGDDNIKDDLDSGGKKDEGDVKGWIDGHPEIGKMQKDIFDDIFDTKDDDVTDEDDPAPIVPTPTDFTENCSCLDHASILFINTNLLLEYRKNWRFLYSTKEHDKSLAEISSRVCYQGPTILVVKDTEGNVFGAHASTSWIDTEGGWVGNGECFLFSIKSKMAIFHSTGKDENFQMLTADTLAMGGRPGNFGLELDGDLGSGRSSGSVDTFHSIQMTQDASFDIDHVEVWGLGPPVDSDEERQKVQPRQPNLNIRDGAVDEDDLMSQLM